MSNRPKKCYASRSPVDTFADNFFRNWMLAMSTVPTERLALDRILSVMDSNKPSSYVKVVKGIGMYNLYKGWFPRTAYCLSGNFVILFTLDTQESHIFCASRKTIDLP